MYSNTTLKFLSPIISTLAIVEITLAGDPDILSDFIVPPNVTTSDGNFFTFTGILVLVGENSAPNTFENYYFDFHLIGYYADILTFTIGWSVGPKLNEASKAEFAAPDGKRVSYTVLEFSPRSINPPHKHPRSAELLFLAHGLWTQPTSSSLRHFNLGTSLLVHFQYNADAQKSALAISAFGSAGAGTVSIPNTLFNTTIDDNVLALSFKTDVATIQTLKKPFAS